MNKPPGKLRSKLIHWNGITKVEFIYALPGIGQNTITQEEKEPSHLSTTGLFLHLGPPDHPKASEHAGTLLRRPAGTQGGSGPSLPQ